jgi:HEPN domain-containing protein
MSEFKEAQKWFMKAENDLKGALTLYNEQLFDLSCFHSQQAVEKALKGYLVSQTIIPPKTHNLLNLSILASKFDSSFEILLDSNLDLSSYAIFSRYPGEEDIVAREAMNALEESKKVYNFCFSKFQALLHKEINLPSSGKPE